MTTVSVTANAITAQRSASTAGDTPSNGRRYKPIAIICTSVFALPPRLAAMIPWEGMFDHYSDFFRHGGIFSSFFMRLLWDSQIAVNQNGNAASPYRDRFTGERSTGEAIDPLVLPGNLSNLYETGLRHPFDDAWYRQRTPLPERIKVPLLSDGKPLSW